MSSQEIILIQESAIVLICDTDAHFFQRQNRVLGRGKKKVEFDLVDLGLVTLSVNRVF